MLKDRTRIIAALLAVGVVVLTIGLLCSRSVLAADPVAPKQTVKWEYATLYREHARGFIRFESAEETVEADGIRELSGTLGVKKIADYDAAYGAALRAIGARGWELVTVGPDGCNGQGGIFYTCYFKRRAN